VGADAECHEIASDLGLEIVVHPGPEGPKRAFCKNLRPDLWDELEVRKPKPFLQRNLDIAFECEVLVACPGGLEEEVRSGTWATVRAARRFGRPVIVIWPDGRVERETSLKTLSS
jgi:hypothetical protein